MRPGTILDCHDNQKCLSPIAHWLMTKPDGRIVAPNGEEGERTVRLRPLVAAALSIASLAIGCPRKRCKVNPHKFTRRRINSAVVSFEMFVLFLAPSLRQSCQQQAHAESSALALWRDERSSRFGATRATSHAAGHARKTFRWRAKWRFSCMIRAVRRRPMR